QQRGRLVEVVGTNLQKLLAGALAEPVREARVQVGARGLGKPGIGNFADQNVLEAIRSLACDRRAQLRNEELPQQQRLEHGLELFDLCCKLLDRAAPEGPADHRGALEDGLLL